MIFADNNQYYGDWLNDARHGKGTFIWYNSDTYIGELDNNTFEGKNAFDLRCGWLD